MHPAALARKAENATRREYVLSASWWMFIVTLGVDLNLDDERRPTVVQSRWLTR